MPFIHDSGENYIMRGATRDLSLSLSSVIVSDGRLSGALATNSRGRMTLTALVP